MAMTQLESLLTRIRDGRSVPEDLDRAVRLVREDDRLPAELAETLWEEPEAAAGGLLALLDDASLDLPLSEAVRAEAGQVEVGHALFDELDQALPMPRAVRSELSRELPIAQAVAAEAGQADLSADVMGALQGERVPTGEAVRAEAGRVDVARGVAAALDAQLFPVREAVRAEAGRVDVSQEVGRALGVGEVPLAAAVRDEAGSIDVVDRVMERVRRDALAPAPRIPEPANRRWMWASLALVAAAVLLVVGLPAGWDTLDRELNFASADEVVVDDLSYAPDTMVQVFRGDAEDEGALIIWVEDDTVL